MLTRELVVLARLLDATCGYIDDTVFSDLLRAPTDAVLTLERHGLLRVTSGYGRALHAEWIDTNFRHIEGEAAAPPDQQILDDIYFMFDQYAGWSGGDVEISADEAAWTHALAYLSKIGAVELKDAMNGRPSVPQTYATFRNNTDFWRRRYPDVDWDTNPSI